MTMPMSAHRSRPEPGRAAVDEHKKTIVLCSPDLNFCLSLSMLFQDRYNVVTTSDLETLLKSVPSFPADLVLVDAGPSERTLRQIEDLKRLRAHISIIMLYVYSAKDGDLDRVVRKEVDSIFYKPFEIGTVSQRIDDLLRD